MIKVFTFVLLYFNLICGMDVSRKDLQKTISQLKGYLILGDVTCKSCYAACVPVPKALYSSCIFECDLYLFEKCGLWGIGIEVTYHRYMLGIYVIIIALLLTFLETTWVVNKFLGVCITDETHPFLLCWEKVLWLDLWKKSILYLIVAIIMFINPHRILLDIGGILLVILAIFYSIVTYATIRIQRNNSAIKYQDHPYSRFENLTHDDVDDTLPELVQTESVVDQQEILTI